MVWNAVIFGPDDTPWCAPCLSRLPLTMQEVWCIRCGHIHAHLCLCVRAVCTDDYI
jgi:hypothetical protein